MQNYSSELGSLRVTAEEFLCGLAIGSTIGLMLAALLTLKPFAEKVIAPYVLVMVTTPMLALVPLLRLMLGFGFWPIPICVALASGPMVMINATTGFRRTDLAKIALARSYGANTLQVFWKIRIPLAMPMIIVGYMVGSIFGLLTSIGGEMVAASTRGVSGRILRLLLVARRHVGVRGDAADRRHPRRSDLRHLLSAWQAAYELADMNSASFSRPQETGARETRRKSYGKSGQEVDRIRKRRR